jgi:putative ABC transport system permease protein
MFKIALRNLMQEKTRLFISVGGVAFSVLLMITLQGLSLGFSNVLGQYFTTVPTDFWVARANSGNIMDPSFVPLSVGPQLKSIDGVASAQPFNMQSLTTSINGKDSQVYLIASDPTNNIGVPTKVSGGKAVPAQGEIVIDRVIAKSNKVKLGDTLTFNGRRLKVVGFSEGTYLLAGSFAFINKQDAANIYALPETTNYWLVHLKQGANAASVESTINRIPGITAHTKDHFVKINVDVVRSIITPVFGALVVLGALIGTAVIGLTIFTSTIEKSKEYGILKAIGLKNLQLYVIVLEQSLIAAVIGFVLGTVLAYAFSPLITSAVPQFITQLRLFDVAWIFVLTMFMAIVASYIPMRRLNKIDPAEVFRA